MGNNRLFVGPVKRVSLMVPQALFDAVDAMGDNRAETCRRTCERFLEWWSLITEGRVSALPRLFLRAGGGQEAGCCIRVAWSTEARDYAELERIAREVYRVTVSQLLRMILHQEFVGVEHAELERWGER